MAKSALRLILLWHMHQPEYRDPLDGRFLAPWTYLHALKDYSDMLAHLERQPQACATFNLTPVLLDQIQAYVERLLAEPGYPIGDELLDALRQPVLGLDSDQRALLLRECLRAHRARMIDRFAPFRRLVEIADFALQHPVALDYLDDGFVADLVVWYHLAWMGEFVREADPRLQRLMQKAAGFGAQDRLELLQVVSDVMGGLLPRLRMLIETGQLELCTSPATHPILPLLLGFDSAREAQPALSLPAGWSYPGGRSRARAQLESARSTHWGRFGTLPAGCWPSEAALSEVALELIGEAGFAWCAGSEATLRRSVGDQAGDLHRPWRLRDQGPILFFRNDALSNLIGFTYKDWEPAAAVADLIAQLEHIDAQPCAEGTRVVTIALDGENAWEHYPENGRVFLSELYRQLVQHPAIELTTPTRCLADPQLSLGRLDRLVAGSWVHGDLATWIGHADKNRAWDMLVEVKRHCDACVDLSEQASRQLAVCEGSDWFWWPGDYNPAALVSAFERLYRIQLAALYRLIGREPPAYLGHAFTHGGQADDPLAVLRPPRR